MSIASKIVDAYNIAINPDNPLAHRDYRHADATHAPFRIGLIAAQCQCKSVTHVFQFSDGSELKAVTDVNGSHTLLSITYTRG